MTPCTRKLARESCASIHSQGRSRPVLIVIGPPGDVIGFRLKGCRQTYYLPVAHCFREALKNELARRRAERKKERAKKS